VNATSQGIARYLEQPIVRDGALPFKAGKVYRHLFSEKHMTDVALLIRDLATPSCWRLLKRYFGGIDFDKAEASAIDSTALSSKFAEVDIEAKKRDEALVAAALAVSASELRKDGDEEESSDDGVAVEEAFSDNLTSKAVWLMSFSHSVREYS